MKSSDVYFLTGVVLMAFDRPVQGVLLTFISMIIAWANQKE